MTDKELLEMAAKAAYGKPNFVGDMKWNPLTDDGDALRLAIVLGIDLSFFDDFPGCHAAFSRASWYADEETFSEIDEIHRLDSFAATRRAIVRAAAEIGKAMP